MKNNLKKYFGYTEFRPLQEEVIDNIMKGNDTFVLMPTGGGKSLCYQLPALSLGGVTLVVSPLIALMKDQVDGLKENGVLAEFINSTLPFDEIDRICQEALMRKVKILYITPERLSVPNFRDFLKKLEISLVAIDEAHCISEWGHDFRPEYRNLKNIRDFIGSKVPIVALTATATQKVADDILQQLSLDKCNQFISSFNRENLTFKVVQKKQAMEKLMELMQNYKNDSVIIYCFSRNETEKITNHLNASGFTAKPYHAGLSNEIRKKNQELFIKDKIRIMVATIAFGMGIDKPDIRLVVHFSFPKSIEGYYQEVGRAGRDGLPSECVMFYTYADNRKHEFFMNRIKDTDHEKITKDKLAQVNEFADYLGCRRKYLLNYFGEEYEKNNCQSCDFCLSDRETFDATQIVQKILSCIARTGDRFGGTYIINVLRGKNLEQIRSNGHDRLSVYGIVDDFSDDELWFIIKALIGKNYIEKSNDKYQILKIATRGIKMLKNNERVELMKYVKEKVTPKKKAVKGSTFDFDKELFNQLRILRKQIAEEKDLPPFMIFGDITLQQMAHFLPTNKEDFANIHGVGQKKLTQFADQFLKIICEYTASSKSI